ncbi:tryptophan halogenase family protein [uncultured Sphingomonas sp.]|uniref:tryptophan halogenase family protein n=1 Tax=uncultured Sphingomonas sp. TaxID=158754 RepID=UPI0035CB37B5
MTDRRIRQVVILGGGTAGWMAAAALSKAAKRQFRISLIESDEIGTIGVGEATIPTIHWFNQLVGLDEARFVRETQATYKLGIEFVGWAKPGHRYFHPFGRYGAPPDGPMFLHHLIRARLGGLADRFEDYSLATQAALAGRFAKPTDDPRNWLSTLGYAYHFDAALYARHLRELAESRGVARREGKVARVEQDGETGFVTALVTDRGERIEGDLFLDCSGMRALLIGDTLGSPFEDWSHWLPCDRALAVPSERVAPPTPFTRATADEAGWRWRIPLRHRTGNGYVYSSAFIGDDAAAAALLAGLDGRPLADPRPIRFRTGRRREAWRKNVVAVGLSSGFLEPLESTSIHLIQSAIAKLLSLFPTRDCEPLVAEQFNRVLGDDYEAVRDFLVLHYHATADRTQPLWEHCRHMMLPDTLVYKEEQFRRTGRIVLGTDELFREASWFAVLMGQGIAPRDYNPLMDAVPAGAALAHLAQVKQAIRAAAERMPSHEAALRDQIAAEPAPARAVA